MTKRLENLFGNLKSNLHYNIAIARTPPAYELGGGYSSDRQMPTNLPCLNNGTKSFSGDSKSVIFFGDSQTFEAFQRDLNVDVTAPDSTGLFSEDLSATYARSVKDTSYTQSFYYSEKVLLPIEIFKPNSFGEDTLNLFGKDVYAQGPNQFRSICGDQLIQQNHLGAGLYATLKVQFNSLEDKITFIANGGDKYGSMSNVSAKIAQVVSENDIKGQLEVSAFQVGGNISQLAKIFSEASDPVISCSLENLISCQKTINAVFIYGTNDFPDQINFKNGTVLGNAASESYSFMPLTYLGLEVGDSIITPEIESARKDLGNLYLDAQNQQDFMTHILRSPIFNSFFNDIKDGIKKTSDNLDYNIELLNNLDSGAICCYNSPEQCPDVLNDMNQKLIPINENFIDQIKNSYNFRITIKSCSDGIILAQRQCTVTNNGSAIAMPIDDQGHFRWDFLENNNTFTILENNDGTISLGINGEPQYQNIHSTKQGQYDIPGAHCYQTTDAIPYPFNVECYNHGKDDYVLADMTLESIEYLY